MQFRSLVFLSLLCSPAYAALKGSRALSRNLKEGEAPLKADKDLVTEKDTEKKDNLSSKKENKADKLGGKKEAKGKKCKNDPTEDLNEEDDTENTSDGESRLRFLNDDEEYYMSCKSFKKGGNCKALLKGVDPAIPEEADGRVGGSLTLEMHPKTGDDAVKQMEKALKKVALASAGCNSSVAIDIESRSLSKMNETEVELDGLKMDGLQAVSDSCTSEYALGAENCSQFGSSLTVYFSGNATDEHITSMMTEFSGTILEEANNGKYDDFADVYWVGASSSGLGLSSSPSTRNNEKNVGGIVGGVIGGLAVVGVVVGGFLFYKKRQGAAVGPSEDGEGFAFPKFFRREPSERGEGFAFPKFFRRED